MDSQTVLAVGIVVLVGGALLVTARLGAVAVGLLPDEAGRDRTTRGREEEPGSGSAAVDGDGDGDGDGDSDGDDGGDGDGGRAHVTDDDCERMRRHLNKSRSRRSPDDLLPSRTNETDSEDS
jgi:hypothetical protein